VEDKISVVPGEKSVARRRRGQRCSYATDHCTESQDIRTWFCYRLSARRNHFTIQRSESWTVGVFWTETYWNIATRDPRVILICSMYTLAVLWRK